MQAAKFIPFYHYQFYIALILVCNLTLSEVDLRQTIPQNGLACPNDKLQLTCTSPGSALILEVGTLYSNEFKESDSVNATFNLGDFVAVLVVQSETTISATLTNEMVMSSDSGISITCTGGGTFDIMPITIADGPANCSNLSVVAECHSTSNAGNSIEAQVLITLSSNKSLMCVVKYMIQFNGKNVTVPVDSPSAEFPINITEAELFDYEIVVYTLDSENRVGQIPCVFDSESIHCSTSTSSSSTSSPSDSTPAATSSPTSPSGHSSEIIAAILVPIVLILVLIISVISVCLYRKCVYKRGQADVTRADDSRMQFSNLMDQSVVNQAVTTRDVSQLQSPLPLDQSVEYQANITRGNDSQVQFSSSLGVMRGNDSQVQFSGSLDQSVQSQVEANQALRTRDHEATEKTLQETARALRKAVKRIDTLEEEAEKGRITQEKFQQQENEIKALRKEIADLHKTTKQHTASLAPVEGESEQDRSNKAILRRKSFKLQKASAKQARRIAKITKRDGERNEEDSESDDCRKQSGNVSQYESSDDDEYSDAKEDLSVP